VLTLGGKQAAGDAPKSEIKVQRRKRTRERFEEPERAFRRADRDNDGPSPDDPPRRQQDRDFDRGSRPTEAEPL
jgi:hypothetical protein